MLGRKNILKCGLALITLVSFNNTIIAEPFSNNVIAVGDSLPAKGKNPAKNSKKDKTKAKTTADNTENKSEPVKNESGVIITSTENGTAPITPANNTGTIERRSTFEGLAEDEVYIEPMVVRREYVLEEDFKLWRTYIDKGEKHIEYRKVEVPYGTYFKKNQMDITEEVYHLETKDLPEGEVKRYKRADYMKMEREKIDEEIRKRYQFYIIPSDSTNTTTPAIPDSTGGNR